MFCCKFQMKSRDFVQSPTFPQSSTLSLLKELYCRKQNKVLMWEIFIDKLDSIDKHIMLLLN